MKTISPNQLSTLSGYTPQRIRQLQSDGVLPGSLARGKLPAEKAIAALFSHLRGRLEKYSESRASSQNREQTAKASLAELDLHERLGNMSPTAFWRLFIVDCATRVRVTLLNHSAIPKTVACEVLEDLRQQKCFQSDGEFRPTCPRCRVPIFDDLDNVDELLKNPTHEKTHQEKHEAKENNQRQNKAGDQEKNTNRNGGRRNGGIGKGLARGNGRSEG